MLSRWIGELLLLPVRLYQWFISPLIGPHCRFHPSCSNYMVEAVRKKGPLRGVAMGIWRLMRCHPWNPGGYDPVERDEGNERKD